MASGDNQPNLNASMIADYPVPLSPLSIQGEIAEQFFDRRAEGARLRGRASQIRQGAEADIEAMILGTKRVSLQNL
jgi:restriction endonuclease S subunit